MTQLEIFTKAHFLPKDFSLDKLISNKKKAKFIYYTDNNLYFQIKSEGIYYVFPIKADYSILPTYYAEDIVGFIEEAIDNNTIFCI